MADRFSLFMNIAARRASESTIPSSCVRQFPTTNAATTELVGFDSRGVARIKVELPKDEDLEAWTERLHRWVRGREDRELRATIKVV